MAGTAESGMLGFVAFEAEDSFADAADDTYTTRLQVMDDSVDLTGLVRPLINRGGVRQMLNAGAAPIPGAFGLGTFRFQVAAHGHGSATNGALTEPDLAKLLGHVFGNSDWTQVGGLLTTGTNDTNTLTSTNTTLLAGGLIRVGAKKDTRADGQGTYLLDATSSYELGVDLPVSPTTADAVRAMGMIYPASTTKAVLTSSAAATNNTLRFVLASKNLRFVARGCACTSVGLIQLNPGELPVWDFTFSCVAWNAVNPTFPSVTAVEEYAHSPCSSGSLHTQAKGTTTRNVDAVREFALTIGQGMLPVFGQGGENAAQNVVGWRRGPAQTKMSFTVEAEASTATPTWFTYHSTDPNSIVAKELLYTPNPVDGSALAIYAPNAVPDPDAGVPTQVVMDGLNFVRASFLCLTDEDGADELLKSNVRFGMG